MALFEVTLLLPFFFVLAIVYGALEVAKVFDNKAVKAIIAVVLAFFAVSNEQVVTFLMTFLPYIAIFFVIFFLAGFILSIVSGKLKKDPLLAMAALVLVVIFLVSQESIDIFTIENENFLATLALLAIVLVLYVGYVMRGGEGRH